jgi:Icc-related predicted phosphoesterase
MKLVFISDTHTRHHGRLNRLLSEILQKSPDSVLVHCGDFSSRGKESEVKDFLEWLNRQKFRRKIIIAGNHDFIFERTPDLARELLDRFPEIDYLEDSGLEIDGIKFWGSPVQPRFFDWAFNRDEDIVEHWNLIPQDTDVLITHGPPYGILDWSKGDRKSVGCPRLLEKIDSLSLKIHAFGHIHEDFGIMDGPGLLARTKFINASYLDLDYYPVHFPIEIEI